MGKELTEGLEVLEAKKPKVIPSQKQEKRGRMMEKEKIIKALECCIIQCATCRECPLFHQRDKHGFCYSTLKREALALTKELTKENERLSTALANYDRQTEVRIAEDYYTAEAYDELREENERLKQLNDSYAEIEQGYIVTGVKKVQADTVREMQKNLNELLHTVPTVYNSHFRKLVAQVVERMLNEQQ